MDIKILNLALMSHTGKLLVKLRLCRRKIGPVCNIMVLVLYCVADSRSSRPFGTNMRHLKDGGLQNFPYISLLRKHIDNCYFVRTKEVMNFPLIHNLTIITKNKLQNHKIIIDN